jgi:hypothetical protein
MIPPSCVACPLDTPTPPLKPEFLAMMVKGVSLILSSCDHALTPSVMRAVGCRVEDGGGRITAFLARSQSRQLLADIASSGRLAAVFSQPSTHLTVQFKSRRVRIREGEAGDRPHLQRYVLSMEDELGALGYPRGLASAMLSHPPDDIVAVEFMPDEAFDQTPGQRAGQRLGAA